MSVSQGTAEQSTAEEWPEAAERGAYATQQAEQRTADLPHGCWVEVDSSNPYARWAVAPCCPRGVPPGPECGTYGCYVEPSLRDENGRPLAAMVRLLDRAQGIACGVPYAALHRVEYRDTTELRS